MQETLTIGQIRRDAEGYNVPPSAVDDITRAQQEAAAARYVILPSIR